MRHETLVIGLTLAWLAAAGRAGAQEPGGPSPIPMPPNPWDRSVADVPLVCGDPGHCPPIRDVVVRPLDDPLGSGTLVPAAQELAGPKARVIGGYQGELLGNPSPLVAGRDAKGAWTLRNADETPMVVGARLGYFGGTGFGEIDVLAETSPGVSLQDPQLDGRAQAVVMAAPLGAGVSRVAALGVWYDGQGWWAFDEAGTKLPAGQRVLYFEAGARGGRATHTAENDFGGFGLVLDDARLNGKASAVLVAQHVFQASRNASALAAFYDAGSARWIVYNADGAPFPLGERVHYIVGP